MWESSSSSTSYITSSITSSSTVRTRPHDTHLPLLRAVDKPLADKWVEERNIYIVVRREYLILGGVRGTHARTHGRSDGRTDGRTGRQEGECGSDSGSAEEGRAEGRVSQRAWQRYVRGGRNLGDRRATDRRRHATHDANHIRRAVNCRHEMLRTFSAKTAIGGHVTTQRYC